MKMLYNNRTGCFKICDDPSKKDNSILSVYYWCGPSCGNPIPNYKQLRNYTHLVVSFATSMYDGGWSKNTYQPMCVNTVKIDGNSIGTGKDITIPHPYYFKALAKLAGNNNLKVYLAFGGWAGSSLGQSPPFKNKDGDLLTNASGKDCIDSIDGTYAGKKMAELCTKYGFDGMDIDYETQDYQIPPGDYKSDPRIDYQVNLIESFKTHSGGKEVSVAPMNVFFMKESVGYYNKLLSKVGDKINHVFIQFYNNVPYPAKFSNNKMVHDSDCKFNWGNPDINTRIRGQGVGCVCNSDPYGCVGDEDSEAAKSCPGGNIQNKNIKTTPYELSDFNDFPTKSEEITTLEKIEGVVPKTCTACSENNSVYNEIQGPYGSGELRRQEIWKTNIPNKEYGIATINGVAIEDTPDIYAYFSGHPTAGCSQLQSNGKKIKSNVKDTYGGTLGQDDSEISNVYAIIGILKNSLEAVDHFDVKPKIVLGLCPIPPKGIEAACNAGCVNSSQASVLVKELLSLKLIDGYGCWSTLQDTDGVFSEAVNLSLKIPPKNTEVKELPPLEWIWKDDNIPIETIKTLNDVSPILGVGVDENNKTILYNGYKNCATQGILDICNTEESGCLPTPKGTDYNVNNITNCNNQKILSDTCRTAAEKAETGYIFGNPNWDKGHTCIVDQ
jgi:hypothetical protein